jgi:hypothetical protein
MSYFFLAGMTKFIHAVLRRLNVLARTGGSKMKDQNNPDLFSDSGANTCKKKDRIDAIELAFHKFHAENPWVYEELRLMALKLKRSGRESYGVAALFEVLRYEHAIQTKSDDGLKLNNNYRALYARMLAQNEPELKEFFRMRVRRPRGVSGQIVFPGDEHSPEVDAWDNLKGPVK